MKILVADDSKTIRSLLTASLNKLGHEVIEAINGQQAIEIYQKIHPDLIILDVIMEGMDGFECARMIRNINPNDWIPIIFLSGAVDDEDISRGINAGGDDYLTKPCSEITLFAKIKAMQRIADMRHSLCEMTKKLSYLSSTDSLTGIYNRLHFDKAISERLSYAKRYDTNIALLFIDLDKFKIVNDSLGHHIGDLLLVEVAKRLKACVRLDDFIARIGGDEFAIILNNVENDSVANIVAEEILRAIEQPFYIAGHNIKIGSSIGIALSSNYDSDEKRIVKDADIAMYHAKVTGRNNYKYYTKELAIEHDNQESIRNSLKHAIENNEFYLTYHPIYNLSTMRINRIEVLLCWHNQKFGSISAEYFIPILEELKLIDHVGEWILRTACRQAKEWYNSGYKNIRLSVNISPGQLTNKHFSQLINNIINETALPPNLLELELTETSDLIFSQQSELMINEIHNFGVNITLDDFGIGYSSLNHLRQLPINAIKIDKSFVKDMTSNDQNRNIINAVIAMANYLGYEVIAEGIENEDQLKLLIENKCKFGQGFYLSKPLKMDQMTDLLTDLEYISPRDVKV